MKFLKFSLGSVTWRLECHINITIEFIAHFLQTFKDLLKV